RKATMIAWGSDEDDFTPVSGYYTQEDAKEIVAYAAERFITVIPEIDMPGHMLAALASYPELGCTGGPYETAIRFGVFKEVLCGGNPKTLQFAKDVVNELMDIFPDAPYIHIGGDECPKAEWEKCPKCQAKIKELGLRDTKEHSKENQLQVYFMSEVQKEIAKRGKKMLAWDEILEGNPNPETTTVMAWTSAGASVKAARLGHHTIVCPISHLYFSNPGYNRLKGSSSVERVYTFEPQSEKLTLEEKKNIIGVQGCIWTEWTKDSLKMEWQMMPRIAALSELQWGNPAKKDLGGFLKRLRHQLDLYGVHSCHYKEDIEDVTISVSPKGQDGAAVVELSTFDNAPVYYTLDGSEPTDQSQLYTEPFTINQTATIKARAIRNGRASNIAEETLTYNLATMRPITLQCEPDERYTYQGADLLVNGLEGNDNYRSGRYIGIYGQDFDATVDLQEAKEISSVSLGTYLVPGDYIFGLSGLEIYGSNDGSTYNKIASKTIPVLEKGSKNNVLKRDTINFDKVQARYVRIVGKKTPELPKWHPGAGKQAYLFLDEIAID
ncbi:MAG: family 20 glycosylhydrolase, partial [Bacteroides sp.]|nr:family 20 glycosylhydrolase [Bacteroides sp.]